VSTTFFTLAGVAAILLILVVGSSRAWSWGALLGVAPGPIADEASSAIFVTALIFLVGIPLTVVERTQMGLQRGYIAAAWVGIGSLLSLLAVLVVVALHGPLPWFSAALLGGPTAAAALNGALYFFAARPEIRPRLAEVDRAVARRVVRVGALFLGLQVVTAITFQADALIIIKTLGTDAVARYSVAQRLFLLAPTAAAVSSYALWPAYAEALARRDRQWIRTTFIRSLVGSGLLAALPSLVLLVYRREIFGAWVGVALVPTLGLALGLGIWSILSALGAAAGVLLNSAAVVTFQLVTGIAMAATSVVLKLALAPAYGVAGIIWGTIVAFCVCTFVPWSVYIYRRFRGDWRATGPQVISGSITDS
jgi:O-antigen/teichoic acid export membrane protein